MKSAICWLLVVLVGFGPMLPAMAQEAPAKEKDAAKPAAKVSATWASGDTKSTASGPRGLSLRDARRMGLTVQGIGQAVKELKDSGAITDDTSDAEVSAMVANLIFSKNAASWGDPSALNWDSILAFIEKMLPIILKLIDLFSYVHPACQIGLPAGVLPSPVQDYSLLA